MVSFLQGIQARAKSYTRVCLSAVALMALTACDVDVGQQTASPPKALGNAVNVALLVPYGSPTPGDDGLARALENAARLAANDLADGAVNITVYRTGGQAATAGQLADRAIAAGADIIVGPLRSDAANAAAVAASDDGINVLAFSNNASIAGGNLFVLGNTFENIATRLMGYAGRQGRNRVVVVHPETPVGQIARNSITRAASRTGVQIVSNSSFRFTNEGITAAAPRVAQTVTTTGANAIMLTSDSVGALPVLAELLPDRGVNPANIQYMGLTRWDVPPQTLSLPGLQGGWFALPDPTLTARFRTRYQSAYGTSPHPLAGLAYDGIAAIGALAAKKRALTAANLRQSSGFVGVNGVFRLKADGTAERALAVAEVNNSQVRIIDPAPKSFSRGGS
ncbi:penicillin-binding protein activator [Litoreibacter roseus]|uniref:Penicillin-binding protein activator n=1 Tax=Litoreibacter roseus TaxID=2601869 RepID=A0A6N6JB84_9RHOB|nr:penicillin-binding protein activator [Litoreibacter roseus]GFE63314.1 penicillin-binding protein activator [Litoreibacter roseus]